MASRTSDATKVSLSAGLELIRAQTLLATLEARGLADRRSGRRVTADDPVRIASISKLVVALGVMVLITTLSVMSGFQREIRDRLLQFAAHATVVADGVPMQDWQQAVAIAREQAAAKKAARGRPGNR